MKPRKVYYRRKGTAMVIEGKRNGKTEFLWTMLPPENLMRQICEKSSILPKEKSEKILKKLNSLDYLSDKVKKDTKKVLTMGIVRTNEIDEKKEEIKKTEVKETEIPLDELKSIVDEFDI